MPEFIQDFNQLFAVPPRSQHDTHRPLTAHYKMDPILPGKICLLSKTSACNFKRSLTNFDAAENYPKRMWTRRCAKCVLLYWKQMFISVLSKHSLHVCANAPVGAEVSKALNPGQQIIKIVNEELIATLGEPAPLNLSGPKPRMIMLVGLQGSGKTTAAGKLARLLRSKGERVMMVAGDPYRPAAVQQLQQLGERIDVPVELDLNLKPPELAKRAFEKAEKGGFRRRDCGYRWSVAVGRGIDERVEIHRGESPARGNVARGRLDDRSGSVEHRTRFSR